MASPTLRQASRAYSLENFGYVFLMVLQGLFLVRVRQDEEIAACCLDDDDFRDAVGQRLLHGIYRQIHASGKQRGEAGGGPPSFVYFGRTY